MNGIIKILMSLEKSDLLIKGVSETIKKWDRRAKRGFLEMSIATLGASFLRNLLTIKAIRAGDGTVRVGQHS